MYGTHRENVVCGLIGGATFAIRRGSEAPFVRGRVKTSTPVRRRLSLTQDVLGKPIPRSLELALAESNVIDKQ